MRYGVEDIAWIGGIVLVALFIFFKIINPITTPVESPTLTTNDIVEYINNLDKENIDLKTEKNELKEELVKWQNVNAFEKINTLEEKVKFRGDVIFIISWVFSLIFVVGGIIIYFNYSKRKNE